MKKEKKRYPEIDWDLKILAWIGAAVIVIVICLSFFAGYLDIRNSASLINTLTLDDERRAAFNEPLGELQSRCGGPDRLPCRPGLFCSAGSLEQMGRCEQTEPALNKTAIYADLQEACGGDARLCAPGYYCKKNQTSSKPWGVCVHFDAVAPFISSVKIENMQLDAAGIYRGVSGTEAKITVQAVNASSVSLELDKNEKTIDDPSPIVAPQAGGSGLYFSFLSINKGLAANLVIKAESESGDMSLVSIPVASAE